MTPNKLSLDFGSVSDRLNSKRIGPSPLFKVGGNFVRSASGEECARYKNHCWIIEGTAYTRYDCRQPVMVHFEDTQGGKSDQYGPFAALWLADGSMYCDN